MKIEKTEGAGGGRRRTFEGNRASVIAAGERKRANRAARGPVTTEAIRAWQEDVRLFNESRRAKAVVENDVYYRRSRSGGLY